MNIIYQCDICGIGFRNLKDCKLHEESHFEGVEKIKYELIHSLNDICDYCDHSYYVYGCEQNCEYKDCRLSNNYKNFIPTKPLHNKRTNGGV